MKRKSIRQLQAQCDKFNKKYSVGTTVLVKFESSEIEQKLTVEFQSTVLGDHTPVAWFEELRNCWALDSINYISTTPF